MNGSTKKSEEIKKYVETNENGNTIVQNFGDGAKVVLRSNFILFYFVYFYFYFLNKFIFYWKCSTCTWNECVFCCLQMECSEIFRSIWSNVSLKAISLLIFCLDGLFIHVSGMFKSLTIVVLLFIIFLVVTSSFMYLGASMLGA